MHPAFMYSVASMYSVVFVDNDFTLGNMTLLQLIHHLDPIQMKAVLFEIGPNGTIT